MLKVEGDELFYAYMVDDQAIVISKIIERGPGIDRNDKQRRRINH
jgi:hypothetical protein